MDLFGSNSCSAGRTYMRHTLSVRQNTASKTMVVQCWNCWVDHGDTGNPTLSTAACRISGRSQYRNGFSGTAGDAGRKKIHGTSLVGYYGEGGLQRIWVDFLSIIEQFLKSSVCVLRATSFGNVDLRWWCQVSLSFFCFCTRPSSTVNNCAPKAQIRHSLCPSNRHYFCAQKTHLSLPKAMPVTTRKRNAQLLRRTRVTNASGSTCLHCVPFIPATIATAENIR